MKAKKKVLKELSLESLGIQSGNKVKLSNLELPAEKPPVKMIAGDSASQVSSLVQLLRNEAKVL
jgi:electron transfer flavoprotein beta subunit